MDSDSISHVMVCRKLLTNVDMEAITTCPSNSQRNVLLLNHVLHMNVSELFAFHDVVQELDHQHSISTILNSGKYHELCISFKWFLINNMYLHFSATYNKSAGICKISMNFYIIDETFI